MATTELPDDLRQKQGKYAVRCPGCEVHTGDGSKCDFCRRAEAVGIHNGGTNRDRRSRRERRGIEILGIWF